MPMLCQMCCDNYPYDFLFVTEWENIFFLYLYRVLVIALIHKRHDKFIVKAELPSCASLKFTKG